MKRVCLSFEWDVPVLKTVGRPTHNVLMHESIESEMFVLDDVNCFVKEETRESRFGEVSLCPQDQDSIEKSNASHLREIKWGRYALSGRGVGSGRFAQFGAAFLKKRKKA